MIALIGVEAEADGGVPRDGHRAAFTAIRYNPSVLRFGNLDGIAVVSEDHINHMVGKHGEGTGERRLAIIIPDAILIILTDITTWIRSHRKGDLGTFPDGSGAIGGFPTGGHRYHSPFVGIHCEGMDHLGIGTDHQVINHQCPLLSRNIGDGNILCSGRHIVLVRQPRLIIGTHHRILQPHEIVLRSIGVSIAVSDDEGFRRGLLIRYNIAETDLHRIAGGIHKTGGHQIDTEWIATAPKNIRYEPKGFFRDVLMGRFKKRTRWVTIKNGQSAFFPNTSEVIRVRERHLG